MSPNQSVSGAGKTALQDLKLYEHNVFKKGINDNFVAQIGDIDGNGFSLEENKIMFELNKILGEKINISATAVRVPISYCHGESVYVKFKNDVEFNDIIQSLNCKHIKVSNKDVFLPVECVDTNCTYVCRIRIQNKNELLFFVVADNLRRGEAYNAVLTLKHMIKNNFNNQTTK